MIFDRNVLGDEPEDGGKPPIHRVPGSEYAAGKGIRARVESVFPFGPVLDAIGLNITVLSYGDEVGFGILSFYSVIMGWTGRLLLDFVRGAVPQDTGAHFAAISEVYNYSDLGGYEPVRYRAWSRIRSSCGCHS